jgi:hypothetical protein
VVLPANEDPAFELAFLALLVIEALRKMWCRSSFISTNSRTSARQRMSGKQA